MTREELAWHELVCGGQSTRPFPNKQMCCKKDPTRPVLFFCVSVGSGAQRNCCTDLYPSSPTRFIQTLDIAVNDGRLALNEA